MVAGGAGTLSGPPRSAGGGGSDSWERDAVGEIHRMLPERDFRGEVRRGAAA